MPESTIRERARAIVMASEGKLIEDLIDDVAAALADQCERDAKLVETTTLGTAHRVSISGAKNIEEAIAVATQQIGKMMVARWAAVIREQA